jgi:hypothetical protein
VLSVVTFQVFLYFLFIFSFTFLFIIRYITPVYQGRDSDSLRAGRSGDRIPVGARLSAPVQIGPRAHPASYTMGTGSFLGVSRPEHGVDHPTPSRAEVKE